MMNDSIPYGTFWCTRRSRRTRIPLTCVIAGLLARLEPSLRFPSCLSYASSREKKRLHVDDTPLLD